MKKALFFFLLANLQICFGQKSSLDSSFSTHDFTFGIEYMSLPNEITVNGDKIYSFSSRDLDNHISSLGLVIGYKLNQKITIETGFFGTGTYIGYNRLIGGYNDYRGYSGAGQSFAFGYIPLKIKYRLLKPTSRLSLNLIGGFGVAFERNPRILPVRSGFKAEQFSIIDENNKTNNYTDSTITKHESSFQMIEVGADISYQISKRFGISFIVKQNLSLPKTLISQSLKLTENNKTNYLGNVESSINGISVGFKVFYNFSLFQKSSRTEDW